VQALADISRSALYCHSNEILAPTANSSNSAQQEGRPNICPSYIRVRAVMWERGEGQTDTQTHRQTRVTNIHFASATPHAKCNKGNVRGMTKQQKLHLQMPQLNKPRFLSSSLFRGHQVGDCKSFRAKNAIL